MTSGMRTVENIITPVSKLLGIMRAVKYKLSRKALNNIYISYIRPILEYAAVVWDGCTAYKKKLDLSEYNMKQPEMLPD